MQKTHILYVPVQFHPIQGGYSLAASNLLRAVEHDGRFEFRIVSHTPLAGASEIAFANGRVDRVGGFLRFLPRFLGLFFLQFSLAWHVFSRRRECDLVFVDTGESALMIWLLSLHPALRSKLMVRFHASTDTEGFMWYPSFELRVRKFFIRSALARIPWILATNRYHLDFVRRHFLDDNIYHIAAKKFFVLPNTLCLPEPSDSPIARELGVEEGRFFLVLGRLSTQGFLEKWIDDVIRALLLLRERGESLGENKFVVVGAGDRKTELVALARDHGLAEAIVFVDRLENTQVHTLQRTARACVLYSRLEWNSMFALECLHNSALLVAADVGGLSEMVEHGHTGFLVPSQDVFALADTLGRVRDMDDASIARARSAARELYDRKYSAATVSHRFAETVFLIRS